MEHIRQFDWCSSQPDSNFLEEDDMDNCVIERIIRNTFINPRISSDSEDEGAHKKPNMDWNKIFKRKESQGGGGITHLVFVAGFKPPPPYPKLSALTAQQHYHCLKVLAEQNPNILTAEFMPKPKKFEFKVFEEVKETYLKEQQEYLEWAKTLWNNHHNIRALRPRPVTENVYEAEFKMRAKSLELFPKNFEMAAHISFANKTNRCEMIFMEDLVKVNVADLPQIDVSEVVTKKFSILSPCPVPQPCDKHPCWFTLPNEKEMSILPLPEVHRSLCQWAGSLGAGPSGATCVVHERALHCLLQADTDWTLPLSVCDVINAGGERKNVLVLGSDFSTLKEPPITRTYKGFRHLLEYALLPLHEKSKLLSKEAISATEPSEEHNMSVEDTTADESDDDWFNDLVIDEDVNSESKKISTVNSPQAKRTENINGHNNDGTDDENSTDKQKTDDTHARTKTTDEFYKCSCSDSVFENPPPRSYRKWQIRNNMNNAKINMIVHCSHKMKSSTGREVITEPIVEYQVDMGGSQQSPDKVRSLALALLLRRDAHLLNVRVDNFSGDIVTVDTLSLEDLTKKQENMVQEISDVIYETISQLQCLLPGHYILQHERSQGENAFLFASRVRGDGDKLSLQFDCSSLAERDETRALRHAPALCPALLPVHKYRKILPLAFTPFEDQVAKEPRRAPPAPPAPRLRAPPHALRWPKRKKKKNLDKD